MSKRYLRSKRISSDLGASMVEKCLLFALIAVVAVGAVSSVGKRSKQVLASAGCHLSADQGGGSSSTLPCVDVTQPGSFHPSPSPTEPPMVTPTAKPETTPGGEATPTPKSDS